MSAAIQAHIIEKLHQLSELRQAEVLDFVEYLATKSNAEPPATEWPQIDPSRDLAKFIGVPTQKRPHEFNPMRYSGTVQWPVDGLAYQEAVRKEWE
ncbi:MAG: DUF2281 domain-containing protein [Rhodoferax sp.]|nr:DUF2281 domain-containing protein [Rhodoferax sp.]